MVVKKGYLVASIELGLVGYVFEVDYDLVKVQPLSTAGRWRLEYVPLPQVLVVQPVFAAGEKVCPAAERNSARPRWGRVVRPGEVCRVRWSADGRMSEVHACGLRSLTIGQSVALGVS